MDLSQVYIDTERLSLVPITIRYAKLIFDEYREPVTAYMNHGAPESLEILEARIKEREIEMKKGIMLFMAVLLKESGEFLGCFALEDLDQQHPEMGGWLKQSAHGNRYGQEAAATLKKWAEANLEYGHIVWPCAAMNVSSRKVAESLGGTVQREYEKTTASGNVWPYVEYWIPRNNQG